METMREVKPTAQHTLNVMNAVHKYNLFIGLTVNKFDVSKVFKKLKRLSICLIIKEHRDTLCNHDDVMLTNYMYTGYI